MADRSPQEIEEAMLANVAFLTECADRAKSRNLTPASKKQIEWLASLFAELDESPHDEQYGLPRMSGLLYRKKASKLIDQLRDFM